MSDPRMNKIELAKWRQVWGWTAIVIAALTAVCAVVAYLAPQPGSGFWMGVLGACAMLSGASWAYFDRAVDRAES